MTVIPKPTRRPKARRRGVTPELHQRVLTRDRLCFLAAIALDHICRDQWGEPHAADAIGKLTVDHVHDTPGGIRGRRAPDDERHLVAMCANGNIAGPSREVREAQRAYLSRIYTEQPA